MASRDHDNDTILCLFPQDEFHANRKAGNTPPGLLQVLAATGRWEVLSREWEEAQKGFLTPILGRNETLAKTPQQKMHACTRWFGNYCQRDRRINSIVWIHGHHSNKHCVSPCGVLISHNNHLRWLNVVGCCWVLLGAVGCWVLLDVVGVVGCCWVMLHVAGCCWMLLGVAGCWWMLLGAVGCCWML